MNTREQLDQAITRFHDLDNKIAELTLVVIAEDVRERFPAAADVLLDWSDQGRYLSLRAYRDAAHQVLRDVLVDADNDDAELDRYASWLGDNTAHLWKPRLTKRVIAASALDPRPHAAGYLLDIDKVLRAAYRTISGTVLTDTDVNALAAEAERGYDLPRLRPRSRNITPVITYAENTTNPDPQVVRDERGRVRVWDSARDVYGWAELSTVVWDGDPEPGTLTHPAR